MSQQKKSGGGGGAQKASKGVQQQRSKRTIIIQAMATAMLARFRRREHQSTSTDPHHWENVLSIIASLSWDEFRSIMAGAFPELVNWGMEHDPHNIFLISLCDLIVFFTRYYVLSKNPQDPKYAQSRYLQPSGSHQSQHEIMANTFMKEYLQFNRALDTRSGMSQADKAAALTAFAYETVTLMEKKFRVARQGQAKASAGGGASASRSKGAQTRTLAMNPLRPVLQNFRKVLYDEEHEEEAFDELMATILSLPDQHAVETMLTGVALELLLSPDVALLQEGDRNDYVTALTDIFVNLMDAWKTQTPLTLGRTGGFSPAGLNLQKAMNSSDKYHGYTQLPDRIRQYLGQATAGAGGGADTRTRSNKKSKKKDKKRARDKEIKARVRQQIPPLIAQNVLSQVVAQDAQQVARQQAYRATQQIVRDKVNQMADQVARGAVKQRVVRQQAVKAQVRPVLEQMVQQVAQKRAKEVAQQRARLAQRQQAQRFHSWIQSMSLTNPATVMQRDIQVLIRIISSLNASGHMEATPDDIIRDEAYLCRTTEELFLDPVFLSNQSPPPPTPQHVRAKTGQQYRNEPYRQHMMQRRQVQRYLRTQARNGYVSHPTMGAYRYSQPTRVSQVPEGWKRALLNCPRVLLSNALQIAMTHNAHLQVLVPQLFSRFTQGGGAAAGGGGGGGGAAN